MTDDLRERVEAHDHSISRLDRDVSRHTARLDGIDADLTRHENDTAHLRGTVEANQTEVRNAMLEVTRTLSTLQGAIAALKWVIPVAIAASSLASGVIFGLLGVL